MDDARVPGLQVACELAELRARLVNQRYRRDHPDASDDVVRVQVRAWWLDRPGAPDGDAVGRRRNVDVGR